jgi:flagellar biosynthesis protein FlhF
MKIKSYYARTVEEAISNARQELGPDALLVNSRKAPPEARHLGEYEVVFGSETAQAPVVETQAAEAPGGTRLSREVAELRQQLEGIRRSMARGTLGPAWSGQSPESSDLYSLLTGNDVSPELARELAQAAEKRAGGARPSVVRNGKPEVRDLRSALAEELQGRCTVAPTLGRGPARPATVALVGPPGAGKTSTLVKLAVHYGLTGRRPTALLSTDTYRIAAAEQLRSYASILGIGFQLVETVGVLAQALEETRGKDLVLIDTPGLGFNEMDETADLAKFLSTRPDIDIHLVLPASMKANDLTRVIDAYEVFRPQRLIFTRMDETGSFGPILNELVRTGKALSFFSTGQRIPEDLQAVTRERVVELLLAPGGERALSAA